MSLFGVVRGLGIDTLFRWAHYSTDKPRRDEMMLMALLLAAPAAADGKTMAQDDWHTFSVIQVGGTAAGSPNYLRVAAGDLDGDGRADEAFLRLDCAGGAVKSAAIHTVNAPRDASSGMPTGKRQHSPVVFVKEWGAATPELQKLRPQYDVKKMEGARAAADGWRPVTLQGTDGLCPDAAAAAAQIVKSKSNITNN
jgi:hypothetical protein